MATRVTSPSDQNRTEVTLLGTVAALRHTTAASTAPPESTRRDLGGALLHGPEVQSAILIDELFQLRVLLLYWRRFCGLLRRVNNTSDRRRRSRGALCSVIILAYLVHVILRLRIRRDRLVFFHRSRPCVVRRQCQPVILIHALQVLEIFYATLDVLSWIETVTDAEHPRGGWSQLHQPLRAFRRHRIRVVVTLNVNDGMHQERVHIMRARRLFDQLPDFDRGRRRLGAAHGRTHKTTCTRISADHRSGALSRFRCRKALGLAARMGEAASIAKATNEQIYTFFV